MRQGWPDYFLSIARVVSTRGTCKRKKVGAVLVQDRHIIATGYNGALPGHLHCEDEGCIVDAGDHCIRAVHAEANALTQAARFGIATQGATIYTTASPCWPCFRLLASAGIARIVFAEAYRAEDGRVKFAAMESGIEFDFHPMKDAEQSTQQHPKGSTP